MQPANSMSFAGIGAGQSGARVALWHTDFGDWSEFLPGMHACQARRPDGGQAGRRQHQGRRKRTPPAPRTGRASVDAIAGRRVDGSRPPRSSRLALLFVPSDKFKVFISWSGALSMRVASVWHDLVKELFDVVEPFMSEQNIGAGERGLPKIASELSGSSFGIIVVTQENQKSQWLNYEAGALSKDLEDQTVRVAPSLVDFERKNDVTGPLGQFQASLLDKGGVEYILTEIAKVVGADGASIAKRFHNAWSEYEGRFAEAKAEGAGQPPNARRSSDEMLDEILTMVRDMARTANTRITPNTPAMVSEFGSSYGTLSKEFVSGIVCAIMDDVPDKGGGVMRTELFHRPDGRPGVVVKSSFEIPPQYREQITKILSTSWRITDVGFEELEVHRVS